MAIGAVVSHRNFGSFVGSGRLCHGEAATNHQRRQKLIISRLSIPGGNCSSPYAYWSIHARDQSNRETSHSNSTSHVSNQMSQKFKAFNTRRRTRGLYQCCLSSASCDGSWVQPRKLHKFGFVDGRKLQSKHSTLRRTLADFKSEEHDMTGTNLDSLEPSEEPSEAISLEGTEQNKPSSEQFPKRWVMVLLCFTAFLLCNMDRVNMSIAILPMSKEFNWNSATVGLIQSSFFWGYLLTQIVGGIWADKIGGKLVLGFGVVWWSIATILTPIAAKVGLPFLLVMRAFMGIGESKREFQLIK